MDEFSYLSVLLSIILGLAVTQILQGFRGLLQSRARVRLYWPALTWAAILLLVYVQSWWAMFGLRRQQDWNFVGFAVVLVHTTLLYMLAGLVLPDFPGDREVDLREHYRAHHRWFFGMAILTVFASLGKDLALRGTITDYRNLSFHIAFLAMAVIGAVSRNEVAHKALTILMAILFTLYTTMLFAHLR